MPHTLAEPGFEGERGALLADMAVLDPSAAAKPRGLDKDRLRALQYGFDLHLVKPIDAHGLDRLLGSLEKEASGNP